MNIEKNIYFTIDGNDYDYNAFAADPCHLLSNLNEASRKCLPLILQFFLNFYLIFFSRPMLLSSKPK